MLIRSEGEAVVCIGQPAHAWVSGQLARAWGNSRFGALEPREEVCLGAEQHDIGMADFDREPRLHPASGRPRSFMEMDLDTHLALWSAAPRRLLAQSRYAALLVSLHGHALYARRDLGDEPADRAAAIRAYLEDERARQAELLAALRADPVTAPWAEETLVHRNQRLVWTWDSLSLALLLDWAPFTLAAVPSADGPVDVALSAVAPRRFTLDPWPLAGPEVRVRTEGRRLQGRWEDEGALKAAFAAAPWVSIELTLTGA